MPWESDILQHAFAFDRALVTPYTVATVLLPALFSYYVLAVLVQLPRTHLYRAALLPVVFWLTFRANMSLDFSSNNPGRAHLNQALALAMFTIAMRSTAWVIAQPTLTRLPIGKPGNGTVNGHDTNTPVKHDVSVSTAMWDACDLIVNLRGIGWKGAQKIHIPAPYFQVESRLIFFLLSLCRAILFAFAADAMGKYVRWFGPDSFGIPKGGSLFDPSLPPLERYMKSSIVTLACGFNAYITIDGVYQLHAALFTLLFQQYPSQWPPLFDSPWLSTSFTMIWGRRWHQLFRECFVEVGGKPVEKYLGLGRAGAILGAFAVSGALHDAGMRGMGRGADTLPVVGFFLLHGVLMIMEYAWKQATGRRVGGFIGSLWVLFGFVSSGQLVVEVWARRGLLGSEFYPEAYRPTTLFLNWISWEKGQL